MGYVKELYMDEVERIAADLEAQGMDPDRAYDVASEQGWEAARDRMADLADHYRDLQKERGL